MYAGFMAILRMIPRRQVAPSGDGMPRSFNDSSSLISGVPPDTSSKIHPTMPARVYSSTVPSAAVASRVSVSGSWRTNARVRWW
jgi:hypothetical protein